MNYRFVVAVFLSLGLGLPALSQTPSSVKGLSPECMKYLTYYQQDYKEKKYDSALSNWRKAFSSCPATVSQNMYVHGTTMYTRLLKSEKSSHKRESLVDTVLMLQDRRVQAYPKKRKDVLNNKGGYIVNYRGKDAQYVYDNLLPIARELEEGSSNVVLVNLFESSLKLYNDGKLPKEDVIDCYSLVSSFLDDKKADDEAARKDIELARGAVGTLFADAGLATCDVIVENFGPRYEADPENLQLVSRIVRLMNSVDGCSSNELYFRAVTTYHRLDPSYRSAYALFRMNAAKENTDEAIAYLEAAIDDPESDEETDAKFMYALADYAYKNKLRAKAADTAKRLISLDNGYVAASYLLLGNLWFSAPASEEIDRFARYWVAADYYQKARSVAVEKEGCAVDDGVAAEAGKLLGSCSRYYPEASEVFMYDLSAGQGYSVSLGGLSASTSVKVRK